MNNLLPPDRTELEITPAAAIVIEIIRARREAYRQVDAFRAIPGELELRSLTARYDELTQDPKPNPNLLAELGPEIEAAQGLLNELDQKRRRIVQELPALETKDGRKSGVTATERFAAFLEHEELNSLDLQRVEHVGDWSGAHFLDREVDELIESLMTDPQLSEMFWCQKNETSEETCVMHLGVIDPTMLSNGLLHVGRNTQKANIGPNPMQINKRTEFLVDLSKLSSHEAQQILKALAGSPGDELVLSDALFWRFNHFIKNCHPAVIPISSIAYVHRDPVETDPFDRGPSQLLDKYGGELRKAWEEQAALQKEHSNT